MALINEIRKRAGVAVGIVAVGLGLFILGGDMLSTNSRLLGNKPPDNIAGYIGDQEITREAFQQKVEETKYYYVLQTENEPDDAQMEQIRNQAWQLLIQEYAFDPNLEEIGIVVTNEEQIDMVQGNNLHPDIERSFTNPTTGELDRDRIVLYLQNLSQQEAKVQRQWFLFERELAPNRLREKFRVLVDNSKYVTTDEAKRKYYEETSSANIKYLYIPYYSVPDSTISYDDDDLKKYFKQHKNEYEVTQSRDFEYVSFPITPSLEDTVYFKDEMNQLYIEFQNTTEDSAFARVNSDDPSYFTTYGLFDLPNQLIELLDSINEGDVIGPFTESGSIKLYKLSEIIEEGEGSVRASHILIRSPESDPEESRKTAKEKANGLLYQLKNGADFAELARRNSQDGSAARGGDLGWFGKGRMVPAFEEAAFGKEDIGLVDEVIETQFGYHIIKVTAPISTKQFKVAYLERKIAAGDETIDKAYRKADYFASTVSSQSNFNHQATKDSLNIREALNIIKSASTAGGLTNATQVIKWLYTEAEKDLVSPVFDLGDQYVVAVMTKKVEKGLAKLTDIRTQIEAKVKDQKKAAFLINKLNTLSGDLDAKSAAMEGNAQVRTQKGIKPSTNSLPSVGQAPIAIGTVFGMKANEISNPIEENSGVIVIEVLSINEASEIADYSSYKSQIEDQARERSIYSVFEAIIEFADIQDDRYKFY